MLHFYFSCNNININLAHLVKMSRLRPNKLKSLFYVCSGATGIFSAMCYVQENEKFYENLIIPGAHILPPEVSHVVAVKAHKYGLIPKSPYKDPSSLKTKVWDIDFKNPIGMAAGFDKDGEAVKNLHEIGFSFVEVGSVTPVAQPGNEKPRVYRLKEHEAIINRYGFNSEGHEKVFDRLKQLRDSGFKGVIGVNLGKNKTSSDPVNDYVEGIKRFISVADYLVINISSPNTAGLRDWQRKDELRTLLSAVVRAVKEAWDPGRTSRPPLLLKLSPDLTSQQLADIAHVITLPQCRVDGLVVSNTTTEREDLAGPHSDEPGGLSGRPVSSKSTRMVRTLYKLTKGDIPIIGVGGVFTGDDAYEKIKAGASLIQLYTSFTYHGPPRITKIKKRLDQLIQENGYKSIAEAVGKSSS